MTKQQATRQRILHEGLALASVVGLDGVSFGTLATQAQLSKSGLFAHFQSREDLQIQILTQAAELFVAEVIAPAREASAGLPRLRALMERWLNWAPRSGLPGGCPFVAGAAEFDDSEGPIRDVLVQLQEQWFATFQRFVAEAVACGHLRADLDSAQFTWESFGIYLAHHFTSRLLHDTLADQRAHKAFETLVAASQDS